MKAILVLVTIPQNKAKTLVKILLEEKVCACVNILKGVESFFWWQGKIDSDKEIGVLCLGGGRSGKVTGFLLQRGFTNVKNIVGGIKRYSDDVDQSLPKYRLQNGSLIPLSKIENT